MKQNNQPSRVWFLGKGCKQVPLDYTRGIVRWAHPDGYFLNAQGQKVPNDNVNPSSQKCFGGSPAYPKDRASNKLMHILMAHAFYGPRPVYDNAVGIVHHLIPDKLDYRPANLLCWLDYSQHRKADNRRRALEAAVPDGDLHVFTYERLRELQDPRTMSDEDFQTELARIREDGFTKSNPAELMEYECNHHCEV